MRQAGIRSFSIKKSIRDGFLLFSPQQRIKLHLIVPIGARVKRKLIVQRQTAEANVTESEMAYGRAATPDFVNGQ